MSGIVKEVVTDIQKVARSEHMVSRGAVIGVMIAVPLFIVGLGLIGIELGLGAGTSFAIGGFAAIWGGLGFGAMCGAVAAYNRDQVRSGKSG
jgi:hypothetical protein